MIHIFSRVFFEQLSTTFPRRSKQSEKYWNELLYIHRPNLPSFFSAFQASKMASLVRLSRNVVLRSALGVRSTMAPIAGSHIQSRKCKLRYFNLGCYSLISRFLASCVKPSTWLGYLHRLDV